MYNQDNWFQMDIIVENADGRLQRLIYEKFK
jgi:hypothetical protein